MWLGSGFLCRIVATYFAAILWRRYRYSRQKKACLFTRERNDQSPACQEFARLLKETREGNRESFGRLLQIFRGQLTGMANRLVMNGDLQAKAGVSDIVQETFVKAIEDFAKFEGMTLPALRAWLRCLLENNFTNFARAFRTRKRQIGLEQPLPAEAGGDHGAGGTPVREIPSAAAEAIHREKAERVRCATERLPDVSRAIVRMHFSECLSYVEIGRQLALSPEAVRKHLTRSLRQVGAALGGEGGPG